MLSALAGRDDGKDGAAAAAKGSSEGAAAADGKASLAKLLKQGPPGDALTCCMC
jgi:hypothetical protein